MNKIIYLENNTSYKNNFIRGIFMSKLSECLIYILTNYNSYRKGELSLTTIEYYFKEALDLLNLYAEGYCVEYNNIKGKPNIPFIPLFSIRYNVVSPNMTKGTYVVLLLKPLEGIYISLNQGTEKALENRIEKDKLKTNALTLRNKVNELLATYAIEYKPNLLEKINLTDNLIGNKKRPISYEEANIKAVFYNLNDLEQYHEKFIRDIFWFIELYRNLFFQALNCK